MVHANTLTPFPKKVTAVVGLFGVLGKPTPETNDQVPVPTAGALPLSVEDVAHIL